MVKRTNKSRYVNYNLKITDYQLQTIVKAVQNHESAVIRIDGATQAGTTLAGSAHAGAAGAALTPRKIPLTQAQINKIRKSKSAFNLKLSAAQLKYLEKSGGFLPLLALLPLIFGGIGAAGGLTGAIASVVSSASNARAAAAAQTELVRHNKEIEAQLKNGAALANGSGGNGAAFVNGSGFISDKIENIPVLGRLAPYLRKLGLGICDCKKLANGERVVTKDGLEVNIGHGIFMGPAQAGGGCFGAALANGSGAALTSGSGGNGAAFVNGGGFISDKIENIPVLGRLAPYLRKLGLGIYDCKKLANGERVVTKDGLEVNIGHGIFMGPSGGNGIFMGPSGGNGIFLGPGR